jgi:hypothetical protein
MNIEISMTTLKEGDKVSFRYNDRTYNGNYYFLGIFQDGRVLVSENKSFETMHLAQNWTLDNSSQLVYETKI